MNVNLDKVPLTVPESLDMFLDSLDDNEKKALNDIKEEEVALFLHTWGEEMLSSWSLKDETTVLPMSYKSIGITHPDDMIGIILTSAWRILHKKPVKLKDQVQKYQEYWMKEIGKRMP